MLTGVVLVDGTTIVCMPCADPAGHASCVVLEPSGASFSLVRADGTVLRQTTLFATRVARSIVREAIRLRNRFAAAPFVWRALASSHLPALPAPLSCARWPQQLDDRVARVEANGDVFVEAVDSVAQLRVSADGLFVRTTHPVLCVESSGARGLVCDVGGLGRGGAVDEGFLHVPTDQIALVEEAELREQLPCIAISSALQPVVCAAVPVLRGAALPPATTPAIPFVPVQCPSPPVDVAPSWRSNRRVSQLPVLATGLAGARGSRMAGSAQHAAARVADAAADHDAFVAGVADLASYAPVRAVHSALGTFVVSMASMQDPRVLARLASPRGAALELQGSFVTLHLPSSLYDAPVGATPSACGAHTLTFELGALPSHIGVTPLRSGSSSRISLFEAVDLAVAVRDGWRQWLAAATPEDWTFWLPSVAAPLHCAASQPLQRHATAFSADIAETVQRLDVGKLTAFTDGRVRGCFEDRALVQVDASGAVSAVLCDGTQVLCTVDSAVRDERLAWYVQELLRFQRWAAMAEAERQQHVDERESVAQQVQAALARTQQCLAELEIVSKQATLSS